MGETINGKNFRTALHGFNREDVVAYIEQQTLEQEKERRFLQDANTRLQKELEEANAALEDAKNRPDLQETIDRLTAELEERCGECETYRDRISALEAENVELRARGGEAPAAPVAETPLSAPIPPVAQVLEAQSARSDFSELELAAYRRAEVTERLARERAADVYRQIQSVFGSAAARFDTGKSDLDQLTKTLQLDINQLLQLLGSIRSTYTEAEQSFRAVSEKNRELAEAEI